MMKKYREKDYIDFVKLQEKYPEVLSKQFLIDYGCEIGWYDLLNVLFKSIQNHLNKYPNPEFTLTCIKEKFGILRIYCIQGDEEIHSLIYMAELMSMYICEYCGQKGKPREDLFWIKTLCEGCYNETIERCKKSKTN